MQIESDSLEARLPFVRGASMWSVVETGNWSADNREGGRFAGDLILLLQEGRHAPLLGHSVREMVRRGHFGAIEVGFFHRISAELSARKGLPPML